MRLTHAEIDLNKLRNNINEVKRAISPGVKIMGIVKANAYGHGLVEISKALVSNGIDYLGVGFLEEGIILRQEGITAPILVLGGVLGSQIREFLENNLEITVSSIEIAERIEQEVQRENRKKARVHLKIDTGMERIGVHAETALPFVERVSRMPHIDVLGIYSHFATSDERDKSFVKNQLNRFTELLQKVQSAGIHIPEIHFASSGAILDSPDTYFTMVRPGIILYGVYPSQETSERFPVEPILTLKSNVVFLKELAPGTSISYGRKYYTKDRIRVATVPIGYGDGYSRGLTNIGEVLIRGKRFPVVGVVCMDQIMVNVGHEAEVHVGDEVVLIGSSGDQNISVWDLALKSGTNAYEFLTGLAARVPRKFLQ
jgi:alanine racemase